jgi:hypothetical protein
MAISTVDATHGGVDIAFTRTRVGPRKLGPTLPRAAARALRVRLRRSYVAPLHSLIDSTPSA